MYIYREAYKSKYEKQGFNVYIISVGDVFRETVKKEYLKRYPDRINVSLADIQNDKEFMAKLQSIDGLIDDEIARKGKEINEKERPNDVYIIDSRLAWSNVPDSYAIRLTVNEAIAGKRVFYDTTRGSEDQYETVDEAIQKTRKRKLGEIERYKEKVKYITITGASNVTGYINDIRKISGLIHKYGGKIIVDGAQLVPHKKICMYKKDSLENIDFLVFSGHKIYAPFGSGAIIGLREDFNNNLPDTKGGGTVEYVIDNNQLWLNTPEKNEAGTPNLFGAVAIMEAMKEIEKIGFERIEKNEKELLQYLINGLKELNRVKLYADNDCIEDRLGILVFTIDGMKYYEVGEKLSEIKAIGVRQGGFCSHPYTRRVLGIPNNQLQEYINKNGIPGLVRVSLGIYNSKKEVNIFLETVELLCRRYAR